ncbi:protein regulator of cytokinesis 1 [Parasteatoda tepidariorum]|uniref:protein regulator of cytokinesis 1 n=1 Tax=Parasteatoda tepidariorum TaxID=114398 RepID=UPI001C72240F|nr:protein regulator of cytokinesis 1 [Parasteatoda tepidariorum]
MEENITVITLEIEQVEIIKKYLQKFYNLWDDFGLNNKEQISRVKLIWNYMERALQSALDDELVQYKLIEDQVRNHTQVMEKLCAILSIKPKEEYGTGLIVKRDNLSKEIERLKDLKHERLKKYQGLRGVEAVYCRLLGTEKIALSSFTGVPSENNLLEIEKHIQKLSKMQDDRQKKFCRFRKELSTIFEVTELSPETSFEKEVISCENVSSLSDETFRSLEEMLSKTQRKKVELEDQKKFLMDELSTLWEELCIPNSKRMKFLSAYMDCKVSTINALEKEVDVCKKIKEEKFKKHIKTLEDELKKLWDKCYITDSVKSHFSMQLMRNNNDEIIDAYEHELSKWKKYYEEVGDILIKVEKRQNLWNMLMELEENVSNPHRLQNRGGNLLQEEKDRKKLQKELPTLEDSIFNDIDLYQSKFGKPFLFYGEDYRNYVTRQWQDRRNKKDDDKLERLRRHSLEMDKEILLKTPLKKPLLRTPNSAPCKLPKSTSKAVNICTPISRRFNAIPSYSKDVILPKEQLNPSLNTGVCGKLFESSSSSGSQDEEQNDILKELNRLQIQADQSRCTTYSEFAGELDSSARCDLRSSILPAKKSTRKKTLRAASRRKSLSKSVPKSLKCSRDICSPSPVRGKLGLPFLM